ncbi:MAG: hypothetical protein CMD85_01115 [Gammaproteobacteria bacterium]|nr:hypothetical protein [Gammaproteobacteria bacterium]|tara:strand:+ start:686 stop:919 length:234 start_codon:yes stop_codon:yes gene_type:complete
MKSENNDSKSISFEIKKDQRYSWCTCGKSQKYPLCDGAHKELDGIQPVRMWFYEDSIVNVSNENGKLQLKLEPKEED